MTLAAVPNHTVFVVTVKKPLRCPSLYRQCRFCLGGAVADRAGWLLLLVRSGSGTD